MKGTSKLQSRHLSADRPLQRLRGCFLGDNAAVPPAYRVKVEKCASSVDILDVCKFTTFCDRKGYSALTHSLSSKWTYLCRTVPNISHLLKPLDDALQTKLIPALTGRPPPNDLECALFALPARMGGLGITIPSKQAD